MVNKYNKMSAKSKAIVNVNLATVLFGFTALFAKILSFSAILIVEGKIFFSCLTLLLAVLIKRHKFSGVFTDYLSYAGQGFLLCVVLVSWNKAIQVSTVAIGNLAYATFPIFVVFTESFFFKEKLKWGDFVSAVLVVLGVYFMIPKFELGNSVMQGVLWGLLSGVSLAFLLAVRKKAVNEEKSSLVITFYEQFFCFIFLLPFSFVFYDPVMMTPRSLWYLALLGIVFSAYPFYLLISSLTKVKAKLAGIIISLEPFYAVILAIIFLHEIPDVKTVFGGAVILFVVFYEIFAIHRRRPDTSRKLR